MSSAAAETPKPSRQGRFAGSGLRDASKRGTPGEVASHVKPSDGAVVPARGADAATRAKRRPRMSAVPESVLQDAALNADIGALPANYSFEVHKTVHRVRSLGARRVALQMPEGLLLYASVLSDILRAHCDGAETLVLGDVTYGACCVDDLSAAALGADLLVHYGHSCLVPVQTCAVPMLYVFVHIGFDTSHLLRCLRSEFAPDARVALMGTIQFVDTLHAARGAVSALFPRGAVHVPQARPLSPGELLGCTSPRFSGDVDALVYVADGRFHLESAMIANPALPAYRYDPYSKAFTRERYAHGAMLSARGAAVERARAARRFGVVLGTLGRQGSAAVLRRVRGALRDAGRASVVVLVSELSPEKVRTLERAGVVDAWVQIACPRLSIDWGDGYGEKPLLTPYEAFVAVGKAEWRAVYPMDFYAKDGGAWSNYYKEPKDGAAEAAGNGKGKRKRKGKGTGSAVAAVKSG